MLPDPGVKVDAGTVSLGVAEDMKSSRKRYVRAGMQEFGAEEERDTSSYRAREGSATKSKSRHCADGL